MQNVINVLEENKMLENELKCVSILPSNIETTLDNQSRIEFLINKLPISFIPDNSSYIDYYHTIVVYSNVKRLIEIIEIIKTHNIAKIIGNIRINSRTLLIAALLHNIGKSKICKEYQFLNNNIESQISEIKRLFSI